MQMRPAMRSDSSAICRRELGVLEQRERRRPGRTVRRCRWLPRPRRLHHVAGAGEDQRALLVGYQPAAPRGGAGSDRCASPWPAPTACARQVLVEILQLSLEALEQSERVRGGAGEARQHRPVAQAAELLRPCFNTVLSSVTCPSAPRAYLSILAHAHDRRRSDRHRSHANAAPWHVRCYVHVLCLASDVSILFGGTSNERRVSVASAQNVSAVLDEAEAWFLVRRGRSTASRARSWRSFQATLRARLPSRTTGGVSLGGGGVREPAFARVPARAPRRRGRGRNHPAHARSAPHRLHRTRRRRFRARVRQGGRKQVVSAAGVRIAHSCTSRKIRRSCARDARDARHLRPHRSQAGSGRSSVGLYHLLAPDEVDPARARWRSPANRTWPRSSSRGRS